MSDEVRRHPHLAAFVALVLAVATARAARADASSEELTVVTLINQQRTALGRAPLGTDVRLFNAAEAHTGWMCTQQTMSHTGSGGSTPGSRATAAGYSWFAVGETIGQGFPTAQDIVDGWQGSPPHWTVLTSATYRDIGVGYVACTGLPRRHYWTAVVANSSRAATPVGAPVPGATATPSRTPTRTATAPPPPTPRPSATILVVTATPLRTATRTATPLRTATRTPTRTATPLRTATRTPTRTATPLRTATRTPTRTPTSVGAPPSTPSTAGATFASRVTLQGRILHGGTTIYVNGAPAAVTADDGSFAVRGLVAGYKTVRARRYGFLDAAAQVYVNGGALTQLPAVQLPSGDTHVDMRVSAFDQLIVQLRYGACLGATAYAAHVDLDGSGCIDAADLALVTINLGRYGPVGWP